MHGTTVVINALTERTGARTALVTTGGFRDVLEIGRGNRPDMYNLVSRKPPPFVPRRHRFEVRERVDRHGAVLVPLDLADVEAIAAACERDGIEAVAVCLLHAYAHPEHEQALCATLRERLPGVAVTASSEVTREWREYERTSTAVLNAYVQPAVDRYLGELEARLADAGLRGPLLVMQSSAGTGSLAAARARPISLVESGPAGGVAGAARIGERIGEPNLIYLDIGGTTAKCSLVEDADGADDDRVPHRVAPRLGRLPGDGAGRRHRRDRRRRRLDRPCRRRRLDRRRPAERRRRSRPGLLRAGRHRADGHGRQARRRACSLRTTSSAAGCRCAPSSRARRCVRSANRSATASKRSPTASSGSRTRA